MAASPAVSPPLDCASAFVPSTSKPVPTVAPAAASPVFRKLRRFPLLDRLGFSFRLILFHKLSKLHYFVNSSLPEENDRTFSARPS